MKLHLPFCIALFALVFFSCKNDKYDLDNIDLTVKVGGDSLAIPLGNTDTLWLNSLIDLDQIGFLVILPDGSYGIRMNDSVEVEVPQLDPETLKIADITLNENQDFSFAEIDYESLKVPEIKVTQAMTLPVPTIDLSGFSFPEIAFSEKKRLTLFEIYEGITIPPSDETSIDIPDIIIHSDHISAFNLNNALAKEIQTIETLHLSSSSTFTITLEKENMSALTDLAIYIDSLIIEFPTACSLADGSSTFTQKNILFNEQTKTFVINIQSIDLSDASITNGNIVFNDDIKIRSYFRCNGNASYGDLPKTEEADAKISITGSSNLELSHAQITTAEIEQEIPHTNAPIALKSDLDPIIKHVGTVTVNNAQLSIDLSLPPLPITPLSKSIAIKFPQWILFKPKAGLDNNIFTITGTIPPKIILDIEALKIDKDLVNGELNIIDSIVIGGSVTFPSQSVTSTSFENIPNKNLTITASSPEFPIDKVELGGLRAAVDYPLSLNIEVPDFPAEVHSLDSVILGNAQVAIHISLQDLPAWNRDMMADITLDFPNELLITDARIKPGNILTIKQAMTNDKLDIFLNISGLALDGKPLNGVFKQDLSVSVKGSLTVENPTINIDEIKDKQIRAVFEAALTNLDIKKVYGHINPNLEPQSISVSLGDLPPVLKGDSIILDFDRPYMILKTKSNLGIPLKADAEMKPFRNGAVVAGASQQIGFTIPRTANPQTSLTSKYWIAKTATGMPPEYQFKAADIAKLIRQIPDSINFLVQINSDLNQAHEADVTASYQAKIAYDFVIPLSFGKDLNIVFIDTIKNLPSILGTIIKGNTIEILGEVTNTLPLDLTLTLLAIDPSYHVIPIDPVQQTILAGKANNIASTTKLLLKLSDPGKMITNLYGFILVFSANTGKDAIGVPVTEKAFVKASLKARIPGGITVNPSDL